MTKTAKCQRCGKYFEVLRPCEGDLHLTILQYGDRGGLEHDAYDLCNTCKRGLGKWLHSVDEIGETALIGRTVEAEFIFVKTCYECKHFRMSGHCIKFMHSRKPSDPACTKWEV